MRLFAALLVLLSTTASAGNTTEMPTREHFAPGRSAQSYHTWHYTPAIKVGEMVIISGIPAAPGDTYEARVRTMFERAREQLEAAGARLADVVEITTFHTQPTDSAGFAKELERFSPIHHEYFPDHYPAWTAVGTTALLAPGAPVEMRLVAVIGSGVRPKADIPQPEAQTP
jgi:enamine deaminase RidA (YjgF/YER057c/UK114 family)